MPAKSMLIQDLKLFNESPWYWIKRHLQYRMQKDGYDGRYDSFYKKNEPKMHYDHYMHDIQQKASGSADTLPDVKDLDDNYMVEVCDRYLENVAV